MLLEVEHFPAMYEADGMSVQEVEAAIAQLSARELAELTVWFENYRAQVWDDEIERDLAASRLDAVLAEVDREYEAEYDKLLS
jgi:hypothetical protein